MPLGIVPSFDLADGGLMLAVVRSMSVTALFSAYGTVTFRVVVAPHVFRRLPAEAAARIDRRLRHLIQASLGIDAAALVTWLVIEAGVMADAADLSVSLAAVGPVLSETLFGHVILLQIAATAGLALTLAQGAGRLRWAAALGLSLMATLLQAGHGHALAMAPGFSLLLVSDGLHLLSAGAWLGGLLPLLLTVRAAPPAAGATASRHFSSLGKLCLYGLVVSAAYQGWRMLGGVGGLVGTAYGWMAMAKALLFVVLLGFAWINRYRLAPALLRTDGAIAKRALVRSIAIQTGFGLAVIAAAGVLSSLPPGLHTGPARATGRTAVMPLATSHRSSTRTEGADHVWDSFRNSRIDSTAVGV
jgi:putative copper resistance protein D